MSFEPQASGATSRAELSAFIDQLADSYLESPERWENDTIDSFLRAWSAWLNDMDGYFLNQGQDVPESPSWQLIAQMLLAARVYE